MAALGDGLRVRVARFGNPRHERILERLRRPYRNILRAGGEIPREAQERITIEATAAAILLDWEGVEERDGRPIPYSREAAVRLLGELKDFRNAVGYLALEAETFRRAALEAAAKNSATCSAGS